MYRILIRAEEDARFQARIQKFFGRRGGVGGGGGGEEKSVE